MGLDIKFNLSEVVRAGMAIHAEVNGTLAERKIAEQQYAEEPCEANQRYIDWLKEFSMIGNIPNYIHSFSIDITDAPNGNAYVRANKWGSLYEPLTDFLMANDILWDEI
jgi:hypothetical protein